MFQNDNQQASEEVTVAFDVHHKSKVLIPQPFNM